MNPDLERAEGAYISSEIYPPEGGLYASRFFTIERVSGDGSVSTVCLTTDEARIVIAGLTKELEKPE